ncbi:PREDICTED: advanced glycosylation end product-specific receptor isoform X2 [Condylura cristata]|uniref:advanced glycosylation end product-specific receptor isoform X2 n=1 Tax=Condylura cristata TaxID=143302 RepID=UPI000642FCD4|nr:PREDICTED: advanced glycosylation end product-specific receptor isoform X2 [Condylura cristata]
MFATAWAVVQGQNVTAQIGKPLVLNCRGVPKKPPQQLEWKLNTGRTEAWKVLSPEGGSWDSVARILPNGSLLLPSVGIQDEGTFQCRAISRSGKEINSHYQVRVYQIPEKPEIIDPASELMAGVPNKVGTCVSEGGYPEGTLTWHLNRKPLVPDGKGVSVKEETRRDPETGLFTLQSELTVTPAQGEAPRHTLSCSFRPGLPRRRPLHSAPIRLRVSGECRGGDLWEGRLSPRTLGPPTGSTLNLMRIPTPESESKSPEIQLVAEPEDGVVALGGTATLTCGTSVQPPPEIHWIKDGTPLPHPPSPVLLLPEVGPQDEGTYSCVATHPTHGSLESHPVNISIAGFVEGLGTLALALGVLGGLGAAALLIGIIVWQRQRRRGEQRKAPENREEEEERAELNQSEEPEAAESSAGAP